MLDFVRIVSGTKVVNRRDVTEVYPKFIINPRTKDLMVRGGDFYAVWDDEKQLWSTQEQSVIEQVDKELEEYAKQFSNQDVMIRYMWDADSGSIDRWHKYVQKQMRDVYVPLDEKVMFSNTERKKTDYASHVLPYPLAEGDISNYEELISTLYDEDERDKLEWAIGAIISGDAKHIQKFIVLYGTAGSGKSTFLNILQMLFDGYFSIFDAKELASNNNSFALESFKENPLVSIQHDGDLSRIEDNTKLNSIVSHETMEINEKFKAKYSAKFNSFLFMGTNKPVKITEAKSGLIRRLIDVKPSGKKLPYKKYKELMAKIPFELGGIAWHCLKKYEEMGESYYDKYIPKDMISATNDFYDFMEHNYDIFVRDDCVTLVEAWKLYKEYCDFANAYQLPMRVMRVELRNYFAYYEERGEIDGKRVRNLYSGFLKDKFNYSNTKEPESKPEEDNSWPGLIFENSLFDKEFADCPAQYEVEYNGSGQPEKRWANCRKKLKDLDTSKTHYVKVPENLIVIDFDIRGKDGEKDAEANIEAVKHWPKTYAEYSKSGAGIHLHYYYDGDISKLSRVYDDKIEIKVFTGNSALRRRLSKCNDIPIATINSGLPLKGDLKMVNWEGIKNEKMLRTMIKKNLNREYHANTKPSVDYIKKLLDDAYESGIQYDVEDMKQDVLIFAMSSTNNAELCVKMVSDMKFHSEAAPEAEIPDSDEKLVFFDIEVFPNLLLVNWKYQRSDTIVRMINPKPWEVEALFKLKLVGFNNLKYDNIILYARSMGYSIRQCYELSQQIIETHNAPPMSHSKNISYTDVFDFCSKKQSLKKWELELDQPHQELGLPWDQPVPEELWTKVAEYCENDVLATEAVFNARIADYEARLILVQLAKIFAPNIVSTPNDTTNALTGRIVFGNNKNPQNEFVYTDLSKIFPGYTFELTDKGPVSTYMGEEVGEGGYVYAKPGMYTNVVTFDVSSMHPHSMIALNIFGDRYTEQFKKLVDLRVFVKHKDFESAKKLFPGILDEYLADESQSKALAGALKIAINSVYGLTAAHFDNVFRDPRNVDNIVAKRGALFMVSLKNEVQKRGYTVIHCKTDSIKVVNPDQSIQNFIEEYGKTYGYSFEIEAKYERICLVNDAVYIAKEEEGTWTATGAQFQVPYVFKTLFSKEPLIFKDLCEIKTVSKGSIYLDMNEGLKDVSSLEKEREKRKKKGEDCTDLDIDIAEGHDYKFVGRAGQFCPIKSGCGGGVMYRYDKGKYSAVTGTKGYRWLESEYVRKYGYDKNIDYGYFNKLVDNAIEAISKYGDFEWFTSAETIKPDFMNVPEVNNEEVPF